MFSFGCLKILDSYNFLAMPLDQMGKIYESKTKTLYPYEQFCLDQRSCRPADTTRYNLKQEFIGNLNIEDFKSSLSYKLPTQEEVDNFNKDNGPKTGKDLTIEYLRGKIRLLHE